MKIKKKEKKVENNSRFGKEFCVKRRLRMSVCVYASYEGSEIQCDRRRSQKGKEQSAYQGQFGMETQQLSRLEYGPQHLGKKRC